MNIFEEIESLKKDYVNALHIQSNLVATYGVENSLVSKTRENIADLENKLVVLRQEAVLKICDSFSDEYITGLSDFLRMHFSNSIFDAKYIAKYIGVSKYIYGGFLKEKNTLPKISMVKLLILFADSNFTTWFCLDYRHDIEKIKIDGIPMTREVFNNISVYDFPHCIK